MFYTLGEVIFARKPGWLTARLMLVIVGVLSPFGASPSSIEGLLYTMLPAGYHGAALPELLFQTGLLAFGTWYWVRHPEKKWFGWILGIAWSSYCCRRRWGPCRRPDLKLIGFPALA